MEEIKGEWIKSDKPDWNTIQSIGRQLRKNNLNSNYQAYASNNFTFYDHDTKIVDIATEQGKENVKKLDEMMADILKERKKYWGSNGKG